MKRILAVLCSALLLSGCIVDRLYYRVRLTVEIMVEGHVYSGTGVVEVERMRQPNINGGGWQEAKSIAKGEAVFVDMGSRGVLFIALQDVVGQYQGRSGFAILPDIAHRIHYGTMPSLSEMRLLVKAHAKGVVDPRYMPMAVHFRDIQDPASVELVDLTNLPASFGPKVSFVKATVEITDDPVTVKIDKVLPWLKPMAQFESMRGRYWNGIPNDEGFNEKVIKRCFETEAR